MQPTSSFVDLLQRFAAAFTAPAVRIFLSRDVGSNLLRNKDLEISKKRSRTASMRMTPKPLMRPIARCEATIARVYIANNREIARRFVPCKT
jgi:hypothetical protein